MHRSSRVLFVEDDEAVREAVAFELRSAGFLVQAEADGNSLSSVVEGFRPDIAILDVMLQVGTGTSSLASYVVAVIYRFSFSPPRMPSARAWRVSRSAPTTT